MRTVVVLLTVALAAMLAVLAFLFLAPKDDGSPSPSPTPTPPASPATTATTGSTPPTPGPAPSGSGSPSSTQTLMWQGKATFEHFTVAVLEDTGSGEMVEGKAGLLVEVCVTTALEEGRDTRISLEPWSLQDSNGNTQRPQDPGAYEPAFPAGGTYGEGECAKGYLTFDLVTDQVDHVELVYANGLGDRAVWQFH
ncbi:hypothetical protein FOJ82_03425 [Tessaracoccus rhinocerotis]|uniref:DUF4352 domain-containing protein n=1 Tax=Tessaracoccus rhinocerotis TaxID=1689449 RepID=A0A553K5G1_9ACTN|nr:hypothetical protein [Tessaracoccus rhinocerotis]TRY19943.1 hypothetical protein FOJ82_03425 [Tessaracoccus rhinocerotis]